mmetsp:Transcript_81284/g.143387  ORF Transcript_81284/g.143387 Transcript_81284/m.143387 type:complete len:277 (+) Transcript_81284:60-890(+)|eukprot:CAMPEP_0197658576 /NCGR_PEP_ID=MMETSP1338-20131121/45318_1 /TAXON_ID=43686 ORGANISM="Pelagodinium beii, Strain RCC1491" /NCGR_SAMPLE_ID=MMETSP1338 /ASSEMBLY_ACC=CAM_ASM_000754 /LENGTH=276 /DNA_ID=CAMNT_0043235187 /DNA_START=60 /DNA_END=890 /DNA_ORIENTATION=+
MECVFFDCDDCLYKNQWATAAALDTQFGKYCETKLGVTKERMMELFQRHGTSLCGLVREGHLQEKDVDSFLQEVHDVHLDIEPDPALREMLLTLPHRRWVFTAATREHAERCLGKLGIKDLFEGIVACSSQEMIKRVGFVSKHDPSCFHAAMDIAGVPRDRANKCMLLDDSVRNIKTARSVGFHTVLVGRQDRKGQVLVCQEADVTVDTLHQIRKALSWLFEDTKKEPMAPAVEVSQKRRRELKPLASSPERRVLRRISTPLSPVASPRAPKEVLA